MQTKTSKDGESSRSPKKEEFSWGIIGHQGVGRCFLSHKIDQPEGRGENPPQRSLDEERGGGGGGGMGMLQLVCFMRCKAHFSQN